MCDWFEFVLFGELFLYYGEFGYDGFVLFFVLGVDEVFIVIVKDCIEYG